MCLARIAAVLVLLILCLVLLALVIARETSGAPEPRQSLRSKEGEARSGKGASLGKLRAGAAGGAGLLLGAAERGAPRRAQGARRPLPDPASAPHIVVDTLNLTHWLAPDEASGLTPESIAAAIDSTAPILKLKHPGRVMYVLKDRESQFNTDAARDAYRDAASRNGVYVYVVERYPDPPVGVKPSAEHSSKARDDFFTVLLARRWRCAVLTEDRLKDFDRFRATVAPFHVYEYAFWRALPNREFVKPESLAHARLRRPKLVRFAEYFADIRPARASAS